LCLLIFAPLIVGFDEYNHLAQPSIKNEGGDARHGKALSATPNNPEDGFLYSPFFIGGEGENVCLKGCQL
jgi:hypothetical protein